MNDMKVFSIGKIVNEEENVKVVVEQKYTEGSKGLGDTIMCRFSGGWTVVTMHLIEEYW